MPADLHIHSTASDGTLAPTQLVAMAREAHLGTIAITDHDSVAGVCEALDAAQTSTVTVIPAVELSAEIMGRSVHILGYFIDHSNPGLLEHLRSLREIRMARARRLVEVLGAGGFTISLDDVLMRSAGGSVGRAHVARALVDAGHVPTTRAAFDRLIGRGKPYYVAKQVASPEAVIATIRSAGGLAVLAHPSVSSSEDLIDLLVTQGLAGIEVYHAQHSESDRQRLLATARRLDLVVTGGSDFHGPGEGRARLGDGGIPEAAITAFLDRARALGVITS